MIGLELREVFVFSGMYTAAINIINQLVIIKNSLFMADMRKLQNHLLSRSRSDRDNGAADGIHRPVSHRRTQ